VDDQIQAKKKGGEGGGNTKDRRNMYGAGNVTRGPEMSEGRTGEKGRSRDESGANAVGTCHNNMRRGKEG